MSEREILNIEILMLIIFIGMCIILCRSAGSCNAKVSQLQT